MPFYPGDYLADTLSLDRAEHGSYLLLMLAYWQNGGPLPDDDDYLSVTAKCSRRAWVAGRVKLSRFFAVENGVWRHKRIDAELAKAKGISEKRQQSGRSGASKRYSKCQASAMANATANAMANGVANGVANEQPSYRQSQSQSHIEYIKGSELDKAGEKLPEIPPMSRKDFDALVEMRGIPKDCANYFWDQHDSVNWLDRSGRPIRKIDGLLVSFAARWRARSHEAALAASAGQQTQPKKSLHQMTAAEKLRAAL